MQLKTVQKQVSPQKQKQIVQFYQDLYREYGPQGWWPVCMENGGEGYVKGEYSHPRTMAGRFEVCVGAILTQNTAWTNVAKAVQNLKREEMLAPDVILASSDEVLQQSIRPAGYYRQKSAYLRNICNWFLQNDAFLRAKPDIDHSRRTLLDVKGVGPETADSILLYAYNLPTFVVDAYTRRIFSHLRIIAHDRPYEEFRQAFLTSLETDTQCFKEYHALIVEHAKQHFQKKKSRD
jgi:endonuclease-3 related protein